MSQSTRQSVLFADAFTKPVVARFDAEALTSDGGLVLLGAIDRRLGLTQALGALLPDTRQAGKVAHALPDLFRQRVYSIAAGYADGNDAARLRSDDSTATRRSACTRISVATVSVIVKLDGITFR